MSPAARCFSMKLCALKNLAPVVLVASSAATSAATAAMRRSRQAMSRIALRIESDRSDLSIELGQSTRASESRADAMADDMLLAYHNLH